MADVQREGQASKPSSVRNFVHFFTNFPLKAIKSPTCGPTVGSTSTRARARSQKRRIMQGDGTEPLVGESVSSALSSPVAEYHL